LRARVPHGRSLRRRRSRGGRIGWVACAVKLSGEDADTCCIAVGPSKRLYQSFPDHIVRDPNDGDAIGCLPHGANCYAPANINDIGLPPDQLRRILRNQIKVRRKGAQINREVLALNETTAA
jgi:hypothetical protein